MSATCDSAAQPMYARSSNLTHPKMLSSIDLLTFLPHASCSSSENQSPNEAQHSFSLRKLIPESENFSSFFYNLGAVQTSIVNRLEEVYKRVDEMRKKSDKTEEWLKNNDRKFILTYIAVGALAAGCFGKKAWTKIKTYSANFKW